jgi:hypothetical protein
MRVFVHTAVAFLLLIGCVFAGQPTPVSVSPASETFTSSATITYTMIASDSDGASDLMGIDGQFGGNYECWVYYDRAANQISVFNDNNHSNPGIWTTETAGQPGAILQGDACNIDPSTVSATASGNDLSVSLTITLGGGTGTHYISLSALNNAGTGSPYVQLGSWRVTGSTTSNFTMAISPDEGFIAAGGTTTATVTITDQPGFSGTVNLSLGQFPNGSQLTGSISPASITGNGSATLTITSSAQSPESRDPVTIYATTPDGAIQQQAIFTTFIDTTPPTVQAYPFAGGIQVDITDGATAEAIQGYNALYNTSLDGRNACWVWYDARTNYLWLASDDATSWSGIVLDGPVTESNSQCTVGSNGSDTRNPGTLGTTISSTIRIEFNPNFAGTKNVYARSVNFAGFDTGYQLQGTFTVTGP